MKHSQNFVSKLMTAVDQVRADEQRERGAITGLLQLAAEESVEVSQACHKLLRIYDHRAAVEKAESPRLVRCRKSEPDAYLNLIFELLDLEAVLAMALDQMEIPNGLSEDDMIGIAVAYTRHKIARNHGIDIPEPKLEKMSNG